MNFRVSKCPKYFSFGLFVLLNVTGLAIAEWEYQRLARSLHNQYRAKHASKSLYSTRELNRLAEKCARYYVDHGSIDHSCPYSQNTGENIWANWGGRPTDTRATYRSIDSWYAEEKKYRYRGYKETGTGHFTQMVWRNTRALGFGVARARNMVVAVGIYWPPGNYIGDYTKNVWKPYLRRYNYG